MTERITGKYVLGNRLTRKALQKGHDVVVSAYKTWFGEIRYTGPVNADNPAKSSVMYRVRVRGRRHG